MLQTATSGQRVRKRNLMESPMGWNRAACLNGDSQLRVPHHGSAEMTRSILPCFGGQHREKFLASASLQLRSGCVVTSMIGSGSPRERHQRHNEERYARARPRRVELYT